MFNVTSWFTIPCWQFCVLFGSEDMNKNAYMHINEREREESSLSGFSLTMFRSANKDYFYSQLIFRLVTQC